MITVDMSAQQSPVPTSTGPTPVAKDDYAYQPVGDGQIRLLTLQPGVESDEIHVRLHHVDLEETKLGKHKYQALSYTWGTDAPTQSVLVDADDGPRRRIRIKTNLASALRRIRQATKTRVPWIDALCINQDDIAERDQPRRIRIKTSLASALRRIRHATKTQVLWIDALCINQGDKAERGHQVALMSAIYRAATRVIIWLGPAGDDSDLAMDVMQALGSRIHFDWDTIHVEAEPTVWTELGALGEPKKQAIRRLWSRPWFERVWIRQEVFLAREAVVFCGAAAVAWDQFRAAGLLFASAFMPERWEFLIRLVYPSPISWYNLRDWLADTECQDPRDKVYGMLALMEPLPGDPVAVDYTLSTTATFTAAAERVLRARRNVRLLDSCELSPRMPGLPSWVPDWSSNPTALSGVANLFATSRTVSFVDFPEAGVLRLAGVMGAPVANAFPFGRTNRDATSAIAQLARTLPLDAPYPAADPFFRHTSDALCCALLNGVYQHSDMPQDQRTSAATARRAADALLALCADADADADCQKLLRDCHFLWAGRALFGTEDGLVGVGQREAASGDRIFFPLGANMPLLVRPAAGAYDSIQYVIVGSCYVSGRMKGEVLYGPMPAEYCLVRHLKNGVTGYKFHQIDAEFKVNLEPDVGFEEARTMAAFGVEDDSDLTPEILIEKGIPVTWVNFV